MLASMSAGVTSALAPGMTTMQFSPALETRMRAVPELPSVVLMAVVSTPACLQVGAELLSVGIVAELADHLDGIAEAGDGDGLIGSFAAGVNLEVGAGDGFAGEGMCSTVATRSTLMLPTTTMGFLLDTPSISPNEA